MLSFQFSNLMLRLTFQLNPPDLHIYPFPFFAGTPHYMSPEVVTNRPYTYASDMWALGCILYEAAVRQPAFTAKGLPQLVVKILRNAYTPLPTSFSRPFVQLVGCLLRADPDQRPTAAELLGTSFVRKHLEQMMALAQSAQPQQALHNQDPDLRLLMKATAMDSTDSPPGELSCSTIPGDDAVGAELLRENTSTPMVNASAAAGVATGCKSSSTGESTRQGAVAAGVKSVVAASWGTPDPPLEFDMRNMTAAMKVMAKTPAAVTPGMKGPRLAGGGAKGRAGNAAVTTAAATAATAAALAAAGGDAAAASATLVVVAVTAERVGADLVGKRSTSKQKSPPLWKQVLSYGPGAGQRTCNGRRDGSASSSTSGSRFVGYRNAATAQNKGPFSPGLSGDGRMSPAKRLKDLQSLLPAPIPMSRGKAVKAWEFGAQWEQQQHGLAERRYQARCLEQRLAREQVSLLSSQNVMFDSWEAPAVFTAASRVVQFQAPLFGRAVRVISLMPCRDDPTTV
jgi:hypothetical protein